MTQQANSRVGQIRLAIVKLGMSAPNDEIAKAAGMTRRYVWGEQPGYVTTPIHGSEVAAVKSLIRRGKMKLPATTAECDPAVYDWL